MKNEVISIHSEMTKFAHSCSVTKERFVEINSSRGIMRGILHESNKRSTPLVIIVHGYFSSDKLGPARLYVKIARVLTAIGFHVLRFDFTGFGESDGEMESVTLDSELEDGQSVISYMENFGYRSGIILLGHSFGSNLSLLLTERCTSVIKVIGISPVYEKNSEYKYLTEDQIIKLNTTGFVSRKGFIVNKNLIDALNKAPGFNGECAIRVPVTIIRGMQDEFYTRENVAEMTRKFPDWRLIEIKGADHNFLDPEARAKLLDVVVNELKGHLNQQV